MYDGSQVPPAKTQHTTLKVHEAHNVKHTTTTTRTRTTTTIAGSQSRFQRPAVCFLSGFFLKKSFASKILELLQAWF